ncbi:hypothetical protein [Burkholderia stagnalis]|uniref:hypothetical protein n=1 Tax=Burkholderia stagnalis TaxID=1503054 RepID=UPI000B14B09F|nr:hypothetical protein [Burkholderia stagnalis]
MIRTDARSVPTTTNAGQADRAGLSGGVNSAVTLKRSNAIRAKPPGLTSSGNPVQRARMSHKRGAVPSSQSSSAAVGSDGSKTQSPPKPADKQASLLEATPAELQAVAHIPVLQPAVLHSAPSHEGNLIDLSDPPATPKPTGTPPSLLEATPDELRAVAHHPVLQPTVLHATHAHEGNLIDLSDPPSTPKPVGTPPSLLEATPDELQAVAHHPVLQPTVLHSAPSHEGNLIDLSDPPPTPKPVGTPPSLLEATPDELQAVAHHPVLQPAVLHPTHAQEGHLIDLSDAPQATGPAHAQPAPFGAAHGSHGAPGTPAFAASGMPSPQQIEHETRQAIEMQRAVSFAKQLLAVAEMVNSFRMKLIDMIRKAVSS